MSTAPKLIVLRAFEPFLGLLTCSQTKRFENSSQRIKNVAKVTMLAILSASYVSLLAIDLLYCYGLGSDLRSIAFPFAILINGTQLTLTYTSLWSNNQRVEQTIGALDEMVEKRKFTLGQTLELHTRGCDQFNRTEMIWVFSLSVSDLIGYKVSQETRAKYESLESRFTSVTSMVLRIFVANYSIMLGASAMMPIFYGIFHYPEPQQWTSLTQLQ